MGGEFPGAILAGAAGALAMLVLVGLVVLLRRRSRHRADLVQLLDAAQREADDLRTRLDEANARLAAREAVEKQAPKSPVPAQRKTRREVPAYVITDAGSVPSVLDADLPADPVAVPDRLVLSATVGAPLVKVAAFSHGVRRALSAESRNRIWFEMRREVRAARKRRRRLVREHLRDVRAEERARVGEEAVR
ncbi:hypothetical protein [Marmoricola sp. RAF53]|uniref:hypothetical protein n=1 Tax=Marmoricola sp. RAF53 TaxID=3233059 RepID=UPI003F94AD2C